MRIHGDRTESQNRRGTAIFKTPGMGGVIAFLACLLMVAGFLGQERWPGDFSRGVIRRAVETIPINDRLDNGETASHPLGSVEGHPLIVALDAAFWTEQERREISTWIWPGRDPEGEWSSEEDGTIGSLLEGREKDLEGVIESIDELHRSLEEPGGTERSWVPLRTSSAIAHPTLFALLAQAHRGSPDVPLRELRRILDEKDPVGSAPCVRAVVQSVDLLLRPPRRRPSIGEVILSVQILEIFGRVLEPGWLRGVPDEDMGRWVEIFDSLRHWRQRLPDLVEGEPTLTASRARLVLESRAGEPFLFLPPRIIRAGDGSIRTVIHPSPPAEDAWCIAPMAKDERDLWVETIEDEMTEISRLFRFEFRGGVSGFENRYAWNIRLRSGQPRTVGEFIWLRLSPESRARSVARDVATRELFRWKSLAEEGPTPSWRGELMVRVEAYLRTHRSSPSLEKLAPPVMREWLGRQERPTLIVAFGLTERPIWNLHLR